MESSKRAKRREHVAIHYEGDGGGDTRAPQPAQADTAKKMENGILPSRALKGVLDTPDNAALALHYIPKGSPLIVEGRVIVECSTHDIPEGHRFTVEHIGAGEEIRSWGIPFGIALTDLQPGQYLCNSKSLQAFKDRKSTLHLPTEPNFKNAPFKRHVVPEESFTPAPPTQTTAPQLSETERKRTFRGYVRAGDRGVGTRNYVVIIGASGLVAGFVRAVEAAYEHTIEAARKQMPNVSCHGVVAVAHTEGSHLRTEEKLPNNFKKMVRTLAGFAVHPNVGGVLIVDQGEEVLQAKDILAYMHARGYPLASVPHRTMSLGAAAYEDNIARASTLVDELLKEASTCISKDVPMSHIVLAQQCGGSDAFSGISANPLAGWLARRLVCVGGSALLAETDELIGAEGYVLSRCRDYRTCSKFLSLVDRFYRYANRRGHSPEGNPSGGNLFRGLYNITLKSAGAAMKKLPDVRLDHVVEYGELLLRKGSGYSFMDSPGNDLESIAGQVASGCNVILFTTGNGSVTNFPFVPTLKALTTTARFELLETDMDINAGLFLDGKLTLDELGEAAYKELIRIASGHPSKGEIAGHHQTQLWRNWSALEGEPADNEDDTDQRRSGDTTQEAIQQESASESSTGKAVDSSSADAARSGQALALSAPTHVDVEAVLKQTQLLGVSGGNVMVRNDVNQASDRVGLILPTSLCSGQVAVRIAQRLNANNRSNAAREPTLTRFVALPHTEGCGHSSGDHEALVLRTLLGYARHPMVGQAVLLEHGCEKTHNARMQIELEHSGGHLDRYGFASVQLDGGFENVANKVEALFKEHEAAVAADLHLQREPAHPSQLRVGFVSDTNLPTPLLAAVSHVVSTIAAADGLAVVAGTFKSAHVLESLLAEGVDPTTATLGYGQAAPSHGAHVMSASTSNLVELVAGLAATGVEVIVACVRGSYAIAPHPLVPLLQCAVVSESLPMLSLDLDVRLTSQPDEEEDAVATRWSAELAKRVAACLSGSQLPKLWGKAQPDFQLSRAANAVSM
ncbi:hypothetical protein PTSG_06233 [Salpingoeca rosetta]|uniref:Altronate hydrolase n=1 Tax=Salpingoeca rosetta (strain ATCC 50818 / BSB-021) TaxID=946362 RepID=F2UCB6_SALR5|nr:uncharacterized protein PTSG_06233 [Salpingoeca rosetta]EGD74223.1 hypothetical protein PTSG_06233 [Salpingoeca rosetta]|eukprot:XP_004993123.1 hypothetical protein PTSG_06233 [Salpingoeca rosetta]